MFFDRHKREDMKKYLETFLHEIMLLLLCFIKNFEVVIIVSKEYLSDFVIRKPEKD